MHSTIMQHLSKLCFWSNAELPKLVDNSPTSHYPTVTCCSPAFPLPQPPLQSLSKVMEFWWEFSWWFTWSVFLTFCLYLEKLPFIQEDFPASAVCFRSSNTWKFLQMSQISWKSSGGKWTTSQMTSSLRFLLQHPFSSLTGNFSSISFLISAGQDITKNWRHGSPPGWIFFYWAALWNPN